MTGMLEPRVILMAASLVPFQVVLTPYKPEPGYECQISQEYYDRKAQMCCAKCPPGERQLLGLWKVVPWRACLSGNEGLQLSLAALYMLGFMIHLALGSRKCCALH